MSFDLAIWKRSARTKTAMLQQCYDAILEGKDHQAMDHVDLIPFFSALESEYGKRHNEYFGSDEENCPFLYSSGKGNFGNWILLNLNWSTHQETIDKIVPLALQHGLLVYDPQHQGVWGNKRPPTLTKTKKRN